MEDEVYSEEDLLYVESSDEDSISSVDDLTKINDKLDRIEALLNEEVSLSYQDQSFVTESGESIVSSTGSGEANYAQYIYDLLLDSNIRVEVVEDKGIFDKQLNDYTVGESLELLGLVLGFLVFVAFVINRYTPKRR